MHRFGLGFRQDGYWGGNKQSIRHIKGTNYGPVVNNISSDVGDESSEFG